MKIKTLAWMLCAAAAVAPFTATHAGGDERHGVRIAPPKALPGPGAHRPHRDLPIRASGPVVTLPVVHVGHRTGSSAWHHHGGAWYRPAFPRVVVSMPPVGAVIPLLPPAHHRLVVGGWPYYYANGVYFTAAPGSGYVVVPSPAGVEPAKPVSAPAMVQAAPMPPDPVIYPRNNQSPEQTETDRQECNRWATTQPAALADANVFQRAVEACMDARGYTLR